MPGKKLGDSYLAQGKTLSARISYDRVLRLRGNDTDALLGLAEALKMENKPREYTLILTRLFTIDSSNEVVAEKLMTQLVEIGHVAPARGTLNIWKLNDPDNPAIEEWEIKVRELEEKRAGGVYSNPPQKPQPPNPPQN